MALDVRFVPVDRWPKQQTPSYARKNAPFRASYNATLDLLEKELECLNAEGVLIQGYFQRADIRNDGWPKAGRRPSQPGIILTFEKITRQGMNRKSETISMPCDQFDDWQDNLRAIALSLEALRKVDRYGVTASGEQYRGFTALPPAAVIDPIEDALQRLHKVTGIDKEHIRHSFMNLQDAYRLAARKTHPDVGGRPDDFLAALSAFRLLAKQLFGKDVN